MPKKPAVEKTIRKLIINSMQAAVSDHGAVIRKYIHPSEDTSPKTRGTFLLVPGGMRCEEPIRLEFSGACRNLIILQPRSSAIIEAVISGSNCSTGVFVEAGASLKYATIQETSSSKTGIVLQQNSRMNYAAVIYGKDASSTTDCSLKGKQAELECLALSITGSDENQDIASNVHHMAAGCKSWIEHRGLLKGKSTFNGGIVIDKNAGQCIANLRTDSLILGEQAQAISAPTLRIMTNGVQAKHAASASQLDEEQLFYLESRGLPHQDARQLLLRAFCSPVLERLEGTSILADVNKLIEAEI